MYRGNSTRVFPIIVIIIIIALIVTAIVSLVKTFIGGENQQATPVDTSQSALLNTDGTNTVRMTVRGPIVSDEKFRSYRISISPSSRSLVTYSGYLDQVIATREHENNVKAYEQFVYALDKANMIKGEQLTGEKDDTRGICATGKVYEFEVLQAGSVIKRLWTSTCKGSPGSFKASVQQVQNLFLEQIPDSEEPLRAIDAI